MKLTVVRKYKTSSYTIGELWIDGEMVCDTMEPTDRGLVNEARPDHLTSDEWIRAKNAVFKAKQTFAKGKIAVPTGYYRIGVNMSNKFGGAKRLFLRNVPGFEGIMIHEGKTCRATSGGILVGKNITKAHLQQSDKCLKEVNDRVFAALNNKETVIIRIMES